MSVRLIQVGYKGIGRYWCKAVQKMAGCELCGIVDLDDQVRRSAMSETDVPSFLSIAEAKGRVNADAVVIATPSPVHGKNVREALDAGLHVLVEKPFVSDLGEAEHLVAHAESRQLMLLVSQNYRYHAESRTLRDVLRAGKVGTPEVVQVRGFNLADVGGSSYRCRISNPHLWEMAVHQFDLLRFLFDTEVAKVFCSLFNPSWSWYKSPAYTSAWLELANGVKVNYLGTYVTQGPQSTWDNDWRIEGSKGTLLWDATPDAPLRYTPGPEGSPELLTVKPFAPANLQGTLDQLLRAIAEGAPHECSARDNLKTLAICAACELSARKRCVVNVEDVLSR